LSETPYYHVTSRCVRRAFLCGKDRHSGRDYEHRRAWIEERVRVLSSLFSVQLCAYAVMSNHYHLVVKLCPGESARWSDDEVLTRWTALFKGSLLVQRYRDGKPLLEIERETIRSTVAAYRSRLGSLSWFMKCLNEPIARRANAEDDCTGHFWEARFHSQPLVSEQALFAAMAYVDLNPVRAQIATTPARSDYTSIRHRLSPGKSQLGQTIAQMIRSGELHHFDTPIRPLMPFLGTGSAEELPLREDHYIDLVDAASRAVRPGKRGAANPNLDTALQRLDLSSDQWARVSTAFREHYRAGGLRLKRSA